MKSLQKTSKTILNTNKTINLFDKVKFMKLTLKTMKKIKEQKFAS